MEKENLMLKWGAMVELSRAKFYDCLLLYSIGKKFNNSTGEKFNMLIQS